MFTHWVVADAQGNIERVVSGNPDQHNIPADAVAVPYTLESPDWSLLKLGGGGGVLVDVPPPTETAAELMFAGLGTEAKRENQRAALNGAVGDARGKFLPMVVGEELVWLEKEAEAKAYVAETEQPSPANYPFLQLEARGNVTMPQAAQLILNKADLWRIAALKIEKYANDMNDLLDVADDEYLLTASQIDHHSGIQAELDRVAP